MSWPLSLRRIQNENAHLSGAENHSTYTIFLIFVITNIFDHSLETTCVFKFGQIGTAFLMPQQIFGCHGNHWLAEVTVNLMNTEANT